MLLLAVLAGTPACGGGDAGGSTGSGAGPASTAVPASSAPPETAGTAPSAGPSSSSSSSSPSAEPVAGTRFAVVGDSITAGFAPIAEAEVQDRHSWVPSALDDRRLEFTGGHAAPGATTGDMRERVAPVDADVLVVMGGTNDIGAGVPWETTEANLREVVATAGAPTVLLSAIPPRDDAAAAAEETNTRLRQLAADAGWEFVDPWGGLSAGGAWVEGTSLDGIHPTEQTIALVGERLAAAIAAVA